MTVGNKNYPKNFLDLKGETKSRQIQIKKEIFANIKKSTFKYLCTYSYLKYRRFGSEAIRKQDYSTNIEIFDGS